MKKSLLAGVGAVALVAGSFAFATPAFADDAVRQAACTAIGGTFANGSNDAADRCNVVSINGPTTINGTTTTSTPLVRPISQVYPGDSDFELLEELAVTTYSDPVYGAYELVSVVNGSVIEGSCLTTGKNKGSVTKCQYNQITTERRTVTTVATTTTPVVEVTEQFQDVETYVTDTTPTTVRTVTTTVSHRFKNNDSLATSPAPTTTVATTEVAGTPIVEDRVTDTEQLLLEPLREDVDSTVDNGGIVVAEPVTIDDVDLVTVVEMTCKNNKGKGDRTNACPTS